MKFQRDWASFNAFGVSVELEAPSDAFMREDSLWRVREIYERFLGLHSLPREGLALDVGAGFGAFAIPFALAFPGWRVLCLEPEAGFHRLLCRNAERLGLNSIVAVPCALGGSGRLSEAARAALATLDPDAIAAAAEPATFHRDRRRPSFLNSGSKAEWRKASREVRLPALPADAIAALAPDLLKIVSPGHEAGILGAAASVRYVVGESWTVPPSRHVHGPGAPARAVYVPVAGTPLRLRRDPGPADGRQGLDVVVAMYNAREWIAECVQGVVGNDAEDIHAVVVDDGSTDGCGELVEQRFAGNPRVRVVRKPNGGCASARNFGRLESRADYVGFVDADDVPDPDLFPTLLELARYSGAAVTQGGFDLMHDDGDGVRFEESSDTAAHARVPRRPFGDIEYYTMPGRDLVSGQPTIWRRVYRRDFLDNRNVWFPEHVRAFDDQIFHMLSLHYAGTIFCTDAVRYHYRQHPGQDIRQGDERGFYSLEMYRQTLKRAVSEGWNDFAPFVRSFANTVDWTARNMRADLRDRFLEGAAELWVLIEKVFGQPAFGAVTPASVGIPEFGSMVARVRETFRGFGQSYSWAYLDSIHMHPGLLRSRMTPPD